MQNPLKIWDHKGRQYLLYAVIGESFKDVADALAKANRENGFSVITEKVRNAWSKTYNIQVWGAQSKLGYQINWTSLRDLGYYEKPGMKHLGIPRITKFGITEVL